MGIKSSLLTIIKKPVVDASTISPPRVIFAKFSKEDIDDITKGVISRRGAVLRFDFMFTSQTSFRQTWSKVKFKFLNFSKNSRSGDKYTKMMRYFLNHFLEYDSSKCFK